MMETSGSIRKVIVVINGSVALDLTFNNIYRIKMDKRHKSVGNGLHLIDAKVKIVTYRRMVSEKVNITKHVKVRVIKEVRTEYILIEKIIKRRRISPKTLKKLLKEFKNTMNICASVAKLARQINTAHPESYKIFYVTNKDIKVMNLKEALTKTRLIGKYVVPFSWVTFILT